MVAHIIKQYNVITFTNVYAVFASLAQNGALKF